MIERQLQTTHWGANFVIEDADLDYLYNLLLEDETPLSGAEMAHAIVRRRVEREQQARKRREQGASVYLPKETYTVGQTLFFPALEYASGQVLEVRSGANPEQGEFDVISVDFGNGSGRRDFAARLTTHKLNTLSDERAAEDLQAPEGIFEEHGPLITAKLEARLQASPDIVRLAGRWFPRALLATINIGHLNLAEAVLDMAGGGPLPIEDLLKEVGLPTNINPRLQAFSLNFALQEDERFDEVGPAGKVLWFLRRLEPPEVLFPPRRLENAAPEYNPAHLNPTLLALEQEIADELAPITHPATTADQVEVWLTFPHRRTGTLPLSSQLTHLFPTALVTPRVRFLWVDGDTGEKFPGWVVRPGQYVYGLDEWYKQHDFPVGGHLSVCKGEQPGEVIIRADKRRPTREWVRTATAGAEGRLAFSMQKRSVAINYDELMIVAVDNFTVTDEASTRSQAMPFDKLVASVFRELAKLNPQSTVHAKTLYAAVNVARRCPPGPIFAELMTRPWFSHVGDAYWRFDLSHWTE